LYSFISTLGCIAGITGSMIYLKLKIPSTMPVAVQQSSGLEEHQITSN
jgi:hypothetical protein